MGLYQVQKRLEISAAHQLELSYESKCEELHGHNWIINVYCQSYKLNDDGMVTDFTHIKKALVDKFDHQYFNTIPPFDKINPTAENIAKYIVDTIPLCYKAVVQESEGNVATYEIDIWEYFKKHPEQREFSPYWSTTCFETLKGENI